MKGKGYNYVDRPDGTLITGVRLVKPIWRDGRDELRRAGKDLDHRFLLSAVGKFKPSAADGELFNVTLNHRGPRKGRIMGQRVNESLRPPVAELDILLTDPDTIARWKRGELPELSADIDLAEEKIYAVSLIEQGRGHFSKDDLGTHFYPADLEVALSETEANHICVRCEPAPVSMELDMKLEELKALLAENNKLVLEDVNKAIDAKLKPVLELHAKPANMDPLDPANDIARAREEKESAIKDADARHKIELEKIQDVEAKVGEAMGVDVGLNAEAYRRQLMSREPQARSDYHRLCLERARNSRPVINPGDDPAQRGKTRVELELAADYDKDKPYWEGLKVSKEQYVEDRLRKRARREATLMQV